MEESLNMRRIRELTKNISVPFMDITVLNGELSSYTAGSGECSGKNLFNDGAVAVQICAMGPKTELPPHTHDKEVEILICFEGEFSMDVIGVTTNFVKIGGFSVIPAGTLHIFRSEKGCKLIGITIPASEGYPHATGT